MSEPQHGHRQEGAGEPAAFSRPLDAPTGPGQPGSAPPGSAPPGYVQPGSAPSGYGPPGYAQPGYAQPGYVQPGYGPPGYAAPYGAPGAYGYGPPPGGPTGGYPGAPGSRLPDAQTTNVAGLRAGQYVLDSLLYAVPLTLVLFVLGFASAAAGSGTGAESAGPISLVYGLTVVLALVGSYLVFVWWPGRHDGQTPAMGWLGLRIVREDGGMPTTGQLAGRWILLFLYAIPFIGWAIALADLITMIAGGCHQRFGDMAAGTFVVRA